jgi:hypothetical protein
LDKDVGHHAVLTRDGSEARKFPVDPNEGCIQIPFAARARPLAAHLAGESGAELAAPTADALMRHDGGEDRGMSLSDRSHSSRRGQEARQMMEITFGLMIACTWQLVASDRAMRTAAGNRRYATAWPT